MFRRSAFALVIAIALSIPAMAQEDGWAAVMRLPPQTTVTVSLSPPKPHKRARPRLCRVLQVSSDSITCGVIARDQQWIEQFARDHVQQIRLEHIGTTNNALRRALVGAAIAGGLGAAAYATSVERHQFAAGASGFLYFGAIGAFVGAGTASEGYRLEHGSVVYRSNSAE
ncbi:MAG TPA: hypothetical protein VFB14_23325 [Bryobacteraceae bacterium]|nr:hypothetical protein [Bryobacteraceae bacterium]